MCLFRILLPTTLLLNLAVVQVECNDRAFFVPASGHNGTEQCEAFSIGGGNVKMQMDIRYDLFDDFGNPVAITVIRVLDQGTDFSCLDQLTYFARRNSVFFSGSCPATFDVCFEFQTPTTTADAQTTLPPTTPDLETTTPDEDNTTTDPREKTTSDVVRLTTAEPKTTTSDEDGTTTDAQNKTTVFSFTTTEMKTTISDEDDTTTDSDDESTVIPLTTAGPETTTPDFVIVTLTTEATTTNEPTTPSPTTQAPTTTVEETTTFERTTRNPTTTTEQTTTLEPTTRTPTTTTEEPTTSAPTTHNPAITTEETTTFASTTEDASVYCEEKKYTSSFYPHRVAVTDDQGRKVEIVDVTVRRLEPTPYSICYNKPRVFYKGTNILVTRGCHILTVVVCYKKAESKPTTIGFIKAPWPSGAGG